MRHLMQAGGNHLPESVESHTSSDEHGHEGWDFASCAPMANGQYGEDGDDNVRNSTGEELTGGGDCVANGLDVLSQGALNEMPERARIAITEMMRMESAGKQLDEVHDGITRSYDEVEYLIDDIKNDGECS